MSEPLAETFSNRRRRRRPAARFCWGPAVPRAPAGPVHGPVPGEARCDLRAFGHVEVVLAGVHPRGVAEVVVQDGAWTER
ncbi:MAG: hypothetical protein R3F30_13340 [Planctomycetota bacterium]